MENVGLLVAFGAGIISFLSPCVVPLVPGYLSLMSGYSVAELQSGEISTAKMLRTIGLFVAGFTAVFLALGAASSSVGSFLARNSGFTERAAGWLVLGFGVLILVMALSDSQVLVGVTRERRFHVDVSRLGGWGPPVMGVAFGFAWTPCIGPVLGVILTAAAVRDTLGQAIFMLFVYAMGLAIPFVLIGLSVAKGMKAMKSFRRWLKPLNIASGILLAAFGVLMITGELNRLSSLLIEFYIDTPLGRIIEST